MRQRVSELCAAIFILVIGVIISGTHPNIKTFGRRGFVFAYSSYESRQAPISNCNIVGQSNLKFNINTGLAKQGTNDKDRSKSKIDYVIYINWDGFAYRYYEWANSPGLPGTPILNYLISRGTLFTHTYNGFPSVTRPMQTSIVTGAWPATHGNTYIYYDLSENIVKDAGAENSSETIAEVLAEQGFSSASVQQFALKGRNIRSNDPHHLYVQPSGSWHKRVIEAIKLLRQEPVNAENGQSIIIPGIPGFLAIYADDLDATGHNLGLNYGFSLAFNYETWKDKLIHKLISMDLDLGLLVDALNDLGILDQTVIILTSDHGMSHYKGKTSLPDVLETLNKLGYITEILSPGEKASPGTDIVILKGGDLSLQFYFLWDITPVDYNKIINALRNKPYFGGYMSRDQLAKAGAHPAFGSLYIWADPPHHFSFNNLYLRIGGQHNTGDESSRRVFMLFSGAGVNDGVIVDRPTSIIDVAPTISHLLGVRQPFDSSGDILKEAVAGY